MTKKLLCLLFFLLITCWGCTKKPSGPDLHEVILKKGYITVGTSFDSKPFAFKDTDGQIKGIEPDLAREISKRMFDNKIKIILRDITPQDRVRAAQSGEVDMVISTMTITRKRKKLVKFSDPYFIAGQVICAKKDRKIESVGDLLNKTVIVIIGTTGEENIKRFAPNALIWAFDDNAKAIKEFETTKAAAITTDDSLLLGLASENSNYIILPTRLTKEPYGIAFKKSDTTKVFEKNLNETINNILNDGTLDMIKEKWGVY